VKLLLKDFQTETVAALLRQLRRAVMEVRTGDLQAVSFSSATGSGKTVMATAAIELLLRGDDEVAPQPDATFLWVTDQPELNEQTRRKMLAASSVLGTENLVVIDAAFDQEILRPGVVHFLNIQKLGKEKGLVTRGDDRTYTIWETVTNTVERNPGKFLVIIDEAHRGMLENGRARNEATTIIQKFIKGSPQEIPAVPLILGISATPERFTTLVQGAGRTNRPVNVDPELVRGSGLIKDVITLHHAPTQAEHTDMTMLRAAVRSWQRYTKVWGEYCAAQGEPLVLPVLVVQVQDGTGNQLSRTDLAEALQVLRSEAGDLPSEAFAHSFQQGTPVVVGGQQIRYLAPPDVQTDLDVRIVFFKTSLNTGWDCPRAEVMMSFRTAADATLIAQLVGRMVRTPLARRVAVHEYLNTVALYLPHYDREELRSVVERLTTPDPETMGTVEVRLGTDVVELNRATGSKQLFDALGSLPTYEIPRPKRTSEVRRLMKLGRLLAFDKIDQTAPEKALAKLLEALTAEYGSRKRTKAFRALLEEKATVQVRALNFTLGTDTITEGETVELSVSPENLDDLFEAAGRRLGEGLHKAWWRARVEKDGLPSEKAKLELIALCFLEADVIGSIEREAQKLVQAWLKARRPAITALPEGRQEEYDEVRRLASEPEEKALSYPQTVEGRKEKQTWEKHLYVDESGKFYSKLNTWEVRVLEAELSRKEVLGWIRNPDRKPWSLCIPYRSGGGWKPLYPDFLMVRSEGRSLVVDILDPHTLSLEDAPAKAVGLADYASKHGAKFGRIELIIVEGDNVKRLDVTDEGTRNKLKEVSTHEHLRQLFEGA
jgi:type III restriction enzyme